MLAGCPCCQQPQLKAKTEVARRPSSPADGVVRKGDQVGWHSTGEEVCHEEAGGVASEAVRHSASHLMEFFPMKCVRISTASKLDGELLWYW